MKSLKKISCLLFLWIIFYILFCWNFYIVSDRMENYELVENHNDFSVYTCEFCDFEYNKFIPKTNKFSIYIDNVSDKVDKVSVKYNNEKNKQIEWYLYYATEDEKFNSNKMVKKVTGVGKGELVFLLGTSSDHFKLDICTSDDETFEIENISYYCLNKSVNIFNYCIVYMIIISLGMIPLFLIVMNYIDKINPKNRISHVYIGIFLLMQIALVAFFIISGGDLFNHYFFRDFRDTAMDFFHSIEYVKGREPYQKYNTLYPPIANLLFLAIYYLIPSSVSDNWLDDFGASIATRGTDIDLRTYQAPFLIYIVYLIVSVLVIYQLVTRILKFKGNRVASLMAWCCIFSYGMLMSYERGNIVIISWIFLVIFLELYESDNKILKELSYMSLAIAAGLKLYPALFGVLIIQRKEFKAAIRTVCYGVMSVVVPCLFFKEGIGAITIWIKCVLSFSGDGGSWNGNSIKNILHSIQNIFNLSFSNGFITVFALLVTLWLIVMSFLVKKKWQKILMLTLAMVLFSEQGEYIYCFYSIPLLYMIQEERQLSNSNILEFITFMIICIPLPLFYQVDGINPRTALCQICMVGLLIKYLYLTFKGKLCIEKFEAPLQVIDSNGNILINNVGLYMIFVFVIIKNIFFKIL